MSSKILLLLNFLLVPLIIHCDEFKNAVRDFETIAKTYGHRPERYQVVTEDGYILTLFRLPGSREPPILLQHGILDSSTTWILRGNDSIGISLANAKHDVWLGNIRGNTMSRRHVSLDPDWDAAFWDVSLEHVGKYDMSAMVDTILSVTGARRLNVIGHSLGNTVVYILGSMKPEYNDKINLLIALSPICYFHDSEEPILWLSSHSNSLNDLLVRTNTHELFGRTTLLFKVLRHILCREPGDAYEICLKTLLFSLSGSDADEISPSFYERSLAHFPAGVARKLVLHLAQIVKSKRFIRFDFGRQNVLVYNSTKPPEFDLGKVTMRVALVAGRNDKLSIVKNVDRLRRRLPNVVDYFIHPREQFNHIDYTWGQTTKYTLFPYISNIIDKFSANKLPS